MKRFAALRAVGPNLRMHVSTISIVVLEPLALLNLLTQHIVPVHELCLQSLLEEGKCTPHVCIGKDC